MSFKGRKPVYKLTQEELAERQAYETLQKRIQRAKMRGINIEQNKQNLNSTNKDNRSNNRRNYKKDNPHY